MTTIDVYARVSRVGDRDVDSDRFGSTDEQVAVATRAIQQAGHQVGLTFVDLDESGGTMRRPAFDQAMARATSGESGGIAVSYLSRFGRTTSGALDSMRDLESAGARLIAAAEGIDTGSSSAVANFQRTLFLAVAEMERDRMTEGWIVAKRRAVERGVYPTAHAPRGYDRGDDGRLVPNDDAPTITRLFELRADGWSWSRCHAWLVEAGMDVSLSGVQKIIPNPAYLGHIVIGRGDRKPNAKATSSHRFEHLDAHPAIVSRDLFERANGRKGTRAARIGPSLLAGRFYCSTCSYPLVATVRSGKDGARYRSYSCQSRAHGNACATSVSVKQDRADGYVTAYVMDALRDRAAQARTVGESSATSVALDALDQAERDLVEFRDDAELPRILGMASFRAGCESRQAAIQTARAALAQVQAGARDDHDAPRVAELVDRYDAGTITRDELREVLQLVLDGIILFPSDARRHHQPIGERVLVVWRGTGPSWLHVRRNRDPRPYPVPVGAGIAAA